MDILQRHKKHSCSVNNPNNNVSESKNAARSELPTRKDFYHFNGAEFSEGNVPTRETLYKIMEMLNIPKERWERIAESL